jgi:outer membrane lipoprotein-sorting protein
MLKSFKIFALILLLPFMTLSQNVYKPMKDTTAFQKKIDIMAKSTNTIESDFVQVKDLSALTEKVTSKGHFCFKKENLLRWEYSTPYKYMIVINKNNILIKDETKVTHYDMNSNKIFKEINDLMIASVQGNILKTGKFRIVYMESDHDYKLELYPLIKGMKESLKKINMYFDKGVTSVIKIEMDEPTGDTTIIDFTNKVLNGTIADSKFTTK